MNLALGGLIIFILLFPGILFRLFLIKSESFENPLDTSRSAELSFMVIAALIFHSLGYLVVEQYYTIHLNQLYYVIIGDNGTTLDFENVINGSFLLFIGYSFTLSIISGTLGYLLKKIILVLYLDFRFNIFNITNEWDNLLSGRIFIFEERVGIRKQFYHIIERYLNGGMSFKRFKQYSHLHYLYYVSVTKIDYVFVDLLTVIGDDKILYKGALKKYFLSKGNSIDKVYLSDIYKKEYDVSGNNSNNFIPFISDIFVCKGDEICNLNITYIYLD